MDPELETVIKILNNTRNQSGPGKGFRIRQTRNSYKSMSNPVKSRKIIKPTEKKVVETIQENIEEELISEINEFYKESDEKYLKEVANKTGSTALWTRKDSNGYDEPSYSTIRIKKYLAFRPYIDPMTIRPQLNPNSQYFFKMANSDVKLIRYTLEDNGFREIANTNTWTIMWHGGAIKSNIYQSLTRYQKVNHFPRSHEITRKDLMYKNLAKMQVLHGARAFDFVPKTYIMPQDAGQLEYEMNLIEATWIVKPSASSQGKGIFLTTKFSDVPKKDHVVSQYIENPLLIDGLKFDLRIYVAITCFNPLRIYIYKDGLVRFATQKYNGSSKGSRFMFLTNYSVNKYSEKFVENDNAVNDGQGSKWSIKALRKLFIEQGIDDEKLWVKIHDLVIKAILSIEGLVFAGCEMHLPYRTNCFELLGFDVLIDDTLNPWLLEVNLSPSMNCDAPIDQKIKGEMISDLFSLSGIVSIGQRKNNHGNAQNKALNYLAYMQRTSYVSNGKQKRPIDAGRTGFESFGEGLNMEERSIIKEMTHEYKRRGGFERIYPTETAGNYKNLFERERAYNTILMNYVLRMHRKNQGAVHGRNTEDE